MNSSCIFRLLALAAAINILVSGEKVALTPETKSVNDEISAPLEDNMKKLSDEAQPDETHKIVKKDGGHEDSVNFFFVNGEINIES